MLNLVLPPIIIVLAIIVLSVFLLRKRHILRDVQEQMKQKRYAQKPKGFEINSPQEEVTHKPFWQTVKEKFHVRRQRIIAQDKIQGEEEPSTENLGQKIIRKSVREKIAHGDARLRKQQIQENMFQQKKSPRKIVRKKKTIARKTLEDVLIERIAVNPGDVEAYERLGDYYVESQSFSDAKECYKQVLRLSPKNFRAREQMRRVETMLQ